jgi:hypothetical protein
MRQAPESWNRIGKWCSHGKAHMSGTMTSAPRNGVINPGLASSRHGRNSNAHPSASVIKARANTWDIHEALHQRHAVQPHHIISLGS